MTTYMVKALFHVDFMLNRSAVSSFNTVSRNVFTTQHSTIQLDFYFHTLTLFCFSAILWPIVLKLFMIKCSCVISTLN